jgi:putative transposase
VEVVLTQFVVVGTGSTPSHSFFSSAHPPHLINFIMAERFSPDGIPGRKTPASGVKIPLSGPNIVLLTVNTKDRIPWLAQPLVQESLKEIWRTSDVWLAGYYVLMPDHLHLFCAPRDLVFTIEKWVAYWKGQFRRRHIDQSWTWQRACFHHRLRNSRQYEEKCLYVRENPLRKKLVSQPQDWPYQGTIHELSVGTTW